MSSSGIDPSRLVVALHKIRFLKRNWLTRLSLSVPALRVLRFARVIRVLRAGRALPAVRAHCREPVVAGKL